jgi:hypothetical protein
MNNKKGLVIGIFLLLFWTAGAKESLRIYCLGYYFSGETYKIWVNDSWYYEKMKKGQDAFYFDVILPDSIYDYMPLDVHIWRKSKWGFRFKSIDLDVYYRNGVNYCLLVNDYRMKSKYSLRLEWTDIPFGNIPKLPNDFWNKDTTIERYLITPLGKNKH